mmetsp:Transcript_21878/g.55688  ORF Transcript_21878/g.55688 Transcript_21878/m.55688 type:complete len:320 (-) Transcript_21878:1241-2200(-)
MTCSPASPPSSLRCASARCWSARRDCRNFSVAPSCTTWFTTSVRTGMCSFLSASASLHDSAAAMMVGMVTMTNSVEAGLRNRSRASAMRALSSSSFSTAMSFSCGWPVKNDLTAPSDSFWRRRTILPMDASRKSGSVSSRSVCPVGAVSKMMRLKCAYCGALRNCTTFEMATASSTPGGGVSSSSPSCRSFSWSAIWVSPSWFRASFSFLPPSSAITWRSSARACSGSSSMPHSGMSPMGDVILTGSPPFRSWSNASDTECAGSVDTTRVGRPWLAKATPRDDAHDVLPTPPLPPSKKYLRSAPLFMRSMTLDHTVLPK